MSDIAGIALIATLILAAFLFSLSIYYSSIKTKPASLKWMKFMSYALVSLVVCGIIILNDVPGNNDLRIAVAILFIMSLSFAWSYRINIKKYSNSGD